MGLLLLVFALLLVPISAAQSPFATAVIDYDPAPGQFVNNSAFNDPARALGPPVGVDPQEPDNTSVVSLGGFGGTLTLAFDHTVRDEAANPFGLDAIVFGNAYWVAGNPNRRWGEGGIIEISRDVNGNGVADDPWYLVPGSHVTDPSGQFTIATWDDDVDDGTYPPANGAWIPPGRSGVWTTAGELLPPSIFNVLVLENPNGIDATVEGIFGYADLSPTQALPLGIAAEDFYTRPDDPRAVGLTPGSAGGDAFDIAWAIDAATGAPAGLEGFDFLCISTGVDFVAGVLGEISTEVAAVADVAEGALGDADGDGDWDCDDYSVLAGCLGGPQEPAASSPCRVVDMDQDGDVDLADYAAFSALFDET